ncbi:MAG TPA: carboxypeptidase-like regulatory domain-containing protein, partial [Bryobacteraceae bacterium]
MSFAITIRLAFALFGLAAIVCAQDRGTITGTITDPGNANVPDARVTVKNAATGLTQAVTTGSDGIYTVPYLPV